MNLGSEIVGITLTVAIVEVLLERRSRSDEARRIAWNVFHELDHAVWVWQGGGREFSVSELLVLLEQVSDDDPLPPFTQNLIMNLGSKSENTIRQRTDILKEQPALKDALHSLSPLSNIRNADRMVMTAESIAHYLREAVQHLIVATKLINSTNSLQVSYRDSSLAMQEWRHYGKTFQEVAVSSPEVKDTKPSTD